MSTSRTICRNMHIGWKEDYTLSERIYKLFNTSTGYFLDLGAAHPWVNRI